MNEDHKKAISNANKGNSHSSKENREKNKMLKNIIKEVVMDDDGLKAKEIIQATGSKSEVRYVPYSEAYGDGFEDMERRVPNIELITQLVGWKPKRDLSAMINDISVEMKKGT